MAEKDSIFSKEYQTGTETAPVLVSNGEEYQDQQVIPSPLEIDANRYGINKPKRIIVRAEIIHD